MASWAGEKVFHWWKYFSIYETCSSTAISNQCLDSPQGAAGKYQIAQEKTQLELDKAHQEIDILREKMERNTGESRRVSYQRRRSTSLWFWIDIDGHRWSWMIIGDHMMDQSKTLSWPHNYTYLAFFSPSFIVVILLYLVSIEWA